MRHRCLLLLSIIVLAFLLFSVLPVSADSLPALYDLNNDGKVNISDVAELLNILSDYDSNNNSADLNYDGQTNIMDVTVLLNVLSSYVPEMALNWEFDEDYHWQADDFEQLHKAPHDWNIRTVMRVGSEYEAEYVCSICGADKEEALSSSEAFTVVFKDRNGRKVSERSYLLGADSAGVYVPKETNYDGYRFVGWKEESTSTDISQFNCSTVSAGIYCFRASYEKEYKVVFQDYSGEQLAIIRVSESNSSISLSDCPAIPTREGYSAHWDPQTILDIQSDTVVTPVYEELVFNVVFKDLMGNTLSYTDWNGNQVTQQTVAYGSFAVEPEHEEYYYDRSNNRLFEFSGWSEDISNIRNDLVVYARFDNVCSEPVVVLGINERDKKLTMSLILPTESTCLYGISLSFSWRVERGTCSISNTAIRSVSPLDPNYGTDHTCTTDEKSDWIRYNNKTKTFDFIWNCGSGHVPNNTHSIESVITLSFDVYDQAVFNSSVFSMTDNSMIVFGDADGSVSSIRSVRPLVWFVE